jgi:hypothetical protein
MELSIVLLRPAFSLAERLQRLQVLARLEPHRFSGRDVNFRTRPGIPADAGLSRFDGEDTESAQLDPVIGLQGVFHAIEDGIYRLFRFCLADSRTLNDLIHKIEFDHWNLRISFVSLFLPSGDRIGNAN